MTPSLSIVIPTYNRPALLKRAVESALAACPKGGEIIVVDDRSDTAEEALSNTTNNLSLNVIDNTGVKGAAGARNCGADIARGDIILFFDDDHTLVQDYPARVLKAAQSGADWGFAALTAIEGNETRLLARPKLPDGLIPNETPLEDKTAAFSAGFWVRRDVFLSLGGIAPDQVNDEDTDLCCRLHAANHPAWFEPEPGCTVYRGYETGADTAPQLTRSTDPAVMVNCYVRTFQRNEAAYRNRPADRWFLLRRALRVAARNGIDPAAHTLLSGLRPRSWQIKGWLFWQMKKAGQRLR